MRRNAAPRLLAVLQCMRLACSEKISIMDSLSIPTCKSARNKSISELGMFAKPSQDAPAILRGFINQKQAALILEDAKSCVWRPSVCLNALDCVLPVREHLSSLAARLITLAAPSHCIYRKPAPALPLRRFPPGASEDAHIDSGPSWTILLHLSYGSTVFHPSSNTGQNVEVHHGPGDVIVWWNSGSAPHHSWKSSLMMQKYVINFGVELHNLENPDCGIVLTAAGCPNPEPYIKPACICCTIFLTLIGFGVGCAISYANKDSIWPAAGIGAAIVPGLCACGGLVAVATRFIRDRSKS